MEEEDVDFVGCCRGCGGGEGRGYGVVGEMEFSCEGLKGRCIFDVFGVTGVVAACDNE